MRSIKEYISEGFYKNVGADPKAAFIKWIEHVKPTLAPSGYITSVHLVNAEDICVDPDGGVYIDCKGGNFLLDIYSGNRDEVFGPELDLVRIKGDVCLTIHRCDNLSKSDIERLSMISDHISIIDIDNCKDIPLHAFRNLSSMKSNNMTQLSIHSSTPTDIKGCPDCQILSVSGEVKSIKGTRINRLKSLDTDSAQVKSLKGAPPVENGSYITLGPHTNLNDGGFRDLLSHGCRVIDALGMSSEVLDRITDGSVWGDVKVKTFNLVADRNWSVPENFPDIIPDCDRIKIECAVYGRNGEFTSKLENQLKRFGNRLDGIQIDVK